MRSDRTISFCGVLPASFIALAACVTAAVAQTYDLRVLHRFTGPPDDGVVATTGVQFDSAGNLYGATNNGGAFDGGTIYKIAEDGTETILHSFEPLDEFGDIVDPNNIVVDASTGDIYGSTRLGGDLCCGHNGGGQLYKLAADGTFTVLHSFGSDSEDAYPSGLIRDAQGNLYGTTTNGGAYGDGTIFEYATDGTYKVLYAFGKFSGSNPMGSLIRDEAGNLYGVTHFAPGGESCGTIYRLAPNGTFTNLHRFKGLGPNDGCNPTSLAADQAGNFYGTTFSTVFKFTSDGTLTTLHQFTFGVHFVHGNNPVLPVNGTLYGTAYGLLNVPSGVLYKIAPDGTYGELYQLGHGSGNFPQGRLTLKTGRLYGATGYGHGGPTGNGTVFSVGVAAQ